MRKGNIQKNSTLKDYYGKDASPLLFKKLYLFDMDGTIYLGNRLFPGVKELLAKIAARGGKTVFITNNASKSVGDYVAKLHRLGLGNVTEDNFFTSAQAAVRLMKERHASDLIYVQGTRSFVRECLEGGLNITTEYAASARAILVAYDPELMGEKMYVTCRMLTELNVPYYATNPDRVCPTEFGYVPDCGSMCEGYALATGKTPVFIGKPKPEMIFGAMKKVGVTAADTVVIGDRLYTDVASGNNAGADTLCVLSGEVKIAEVNAAQGAGKPTYVLEHVNRLLPFL